MKRIYLTGPMRNYSSNQKEEFEQAKQLLEAQGYTVQTAMEQCEGYDPHGESFPVNLVMKQRMLELLKSDIVVYLNDYEQDIWSTHEVRIAKYLEIETRGINYMLKPNQNENRNDIEATTTTEPSHASDQQG